MGFISVANNPWTVPWKCPSSLAYAQISIYTLYHNRNVELKLISWKCISKLV